MNKPNSRPETPRLGASQAQLQRAADYVSDNWFPTNPISLKKVKELLKNSDTDTKIILDELRKDCSLYLYCLKELRKLVAQELGSSKQDPLQALRDADLITLKKILDIPETKVSSHSFSEMSSLQANRLNHAMVSASVAQVISAEVDIDQETGYSCALLRQLGITLIAWNYPHVYERAVSNQSESETLDSLLNRFLGFTPTLLAIQIAKDWAMPNDIRASMGDRKALSESATANQGTVNLLSKICKIGETLAIVNDPQNYPSSKADLDFVQNEIKNMLGSSGLDLIKQKIEVNCANYLQEQPELFRIEIEKSPKLGSFSAQVQELISKNNSLKFCPPELQEIIKRAYLQTEPGQVSRQGISILASEAVIKAGFLKGCIYLADPEAQQLTPRLRLGPTELRYFKPVSYYSSESDLIGTAFRCTSIVKEERTQEEGVITAQMAGSLGYHEKAGVILLQLSKELLLSIDNQAGIRFKALRQAFADCMGLD